MELFLYKGKLCYSLSGEKQQICILSEQEKDTVLVSGGPECVLFHAYSLDKDNLYYVYAGRDEEGCLSFYEEGKNEKFELTGEFAGGVCICDGMTIMTLVLGISG